MCKELEAIEWLETKCYVESPQDETFDKCINIIKPALQRLETIEKVKPSEALRALDRNIVVIREKDYTIIQQALLKAQEQENVLKIIEEKDVDIYILNSCKTVNEYNSKIVHIVGEIRELNEKEFELLKEVLCYERKNNC